MMHNSCFNVTVLFKSKYYSLVIFPGKAILAVGGKSHLLKLQ